MTDIYENLDHMIDLCQRKAVTLLGLKRVLRLADLLGVPPASLKETVRTAVRPTGSFPTFDPTPWKRRVFSVRVGDGPWEDFPLAEVHMDLWPADMVTAYEVWHRRREQNRQRRQSTSGAAITLP
jgi:hypothetical protein